MVSMETIIDLYKKEVNKTIEESLLENGLSESESKEILDIMKARLTNYEATLDIPYAVVVLLQEMYDQNDYKEVLKKMEDRKGIKLVELSSFEKRQFAYAMLDYLECRGLLPLFVRLWGALDDIKG